jgi:hypothetical protein
MTPEQRRAEIDRKYPFQVDVPYLDDWDSARERMDYLITYIGTFDMYVVAEDGRACVRHCFAIEADAELFRAFLRRAAQRALANVPPQPATDAEAEQREIDNRFPFHVDLPHVVDEQEAQRFKAYIVRHIGRFAAYEVTDDGRMRSRYGFRTFEEAEMFRWGLAGRAGRRSAR